MYISNISFCIFSRATLNETFTAKYDGVLPRTPLMRPKSEIYTPKRDDVHPHHFHRRSPPRSKITVFVWGKNTILKFLENTK